MKKYLFASVLALLPLASAQAVIIDGADLLTDSTVTLPNGSAGVVGSSLQFSAAVTGAVLVDIDLSAYGIGTSAGQNTSGSVSVTNTRLTSDSDLWFGLWDGSSFAAISSWDGDRSATQTSSVSNGITFNEVGGGTTISFSTTQAIGEAMTATYSFDLLTGVIDLAVGGILNSTTLPGGFNTASSLSFLVGMGTTNERHQIDQIEISGAIAQVPEPATLALMGLGLAGVGFQRSKKKVA